MIIIRTRRDRLVYIAQNSIIVTKTANYFRVFTLHQQALNDDEHQPTSLSIAKNMCIGAPTVEMNAPSA